MARTSDVTVSTTSSFAEYRGFFIYVVSAAFLFVWAAWLLVPDHHLEALHIEYYPDKYWSRAIPAWLLMLMVYGYVYVALYNTEVKTNKLDDVRNFVDEYTVHPADIGLRDVEYVHKALSGVWDLPVSLVNEILYDDVRAK